MSSMSRVASASNILAPLWESLASSPINLSLLSPCAAGGELGWGLVRRIPSPLTPVPRGRGEPECRLTLRLSDMAKTGIVERVLTEWFRVGLLPTQRAVARF